jgi:hypothetical protein
MPSARPSFQTGYHSSTGRFTPWTDDAIAESVEVSLLAVVRVHQQYASEAYL